MPTICSWLREQSGKRSRGFQEPFQEVGEACALKASAQMPEWLYLYAAPRTITCSNRAAREMCLPGGFPSRQGAVLREAAGGAVATAI